MFVDAEAKLTLRSESSKGSGSEEESSGTRYRSDDNGDTQDV